MTKISLFLLCALSLNNRSPWPSTTTSSLLVKCYFLRNCPVGYVAKMQWAAWLFWMPFLFSSPMILTFYPFEDKSHRTPQCCFFFFLIKKETFSTTIWFLCKCTQWFWSHPNPSTHRTSSLTLWWIRRRIKSLFEDYRKGIPHVLVCVCIGNLF